MLSELSHGSAQTRIGAKHDKLARAAYSALERNSRNCPAANNHQNDANETEEGPIGESHNQPRLRISKADFEHDLLGENRVNLPGETQQGFGEGVLPENHNHEIQIVCPRGNLRITTGRAN